MNNRCLFQTVPVTFWSMIRTLKTRIFSVASSFTGVAHVVSVVRGQIHLTVLAAQTRLRSISTHYSLSEVREDGTSFFEYCCSNCMTPMMPANSQQGDKHASDNAPTSKFLDILLQGDIIFGGIQRGSISFKRRRLRNLDNSALQS